MAYPLNANDNDNHYYLHEEKVVNENYYQLVVSQSVDENDSYLG
jgi:hypothetical protein